jgi:hypothetical protein
VDGCSGFGAFDTHVGSPRGARIHSVQESSLHGAMPALDNVSGCASRRISVGDRNRSGLDRIE